jgi:two-component system response regulator NreC
MRKLVVADDHQLMREGLRALIERTLRDEVEIVDEASDLAGTLRTVRLHRPHLLVLDLNMPGGSAVSVVSTLVQEQPGLAILMVTMHDEPTLARNVLAAGARGYLLKQSAYDEFVSAVRAVLAGEVYVDPHMRALPAEPTTNVELSDRETQVVGMLARGLTYAEVGAELFISVRTVETHRRNVMDKLGLTRKADLLRYALERGLVSPENARLGRA